MRMSSLGSPAGEQNGHVVGSTASCVGISGGQTGLTLVDSFSELSYGLAVRQVQLHAHDILVARSLDDVFDGCLGSVHVTAGHDDLCPCGAKSRPGGNHERRKFEKCQFLMAKGRHLVTKHRRYFILA